ncbi:hypothetical protein [Cognatiyoonia sp. IB215182]|uniref:hypothetical protein n=1 Tax=Cognatiyoonia sp. IB215182 TaxID=3097353 RepID=UPI002A0F915B|nr:hypothetical protein [Cognatiyoonia sp. IB215182]MDX8355790.1 hypothetical protein [Cognatiyoonia sp. IB215182]
MPQAFLRHNRNAKVGGDHAGDCLQPVQLHRIVHDDIIALRPSLDLPTHDGIPIKPNEGL